MAHKLPKPMIHVRCGTCFYNLTWNDKLETFECTYCMTRILHCGDGVFESTYADPDSKPCHQPPMDAFKKIRHLRLNSNDERYFVVFSYTFFPCALPKGHSSPHYFPYNARYSEETLDHVEYTARDL